MTTVITGAALPRQDGPVKVTGAARYANDHHAEQMLHGLLVGAPVPAGRLRAIDTTAAAAVPGVVRVLTHADFPRLNAAPVPPYFSERLPLQDAEIRHEGEPIAVVLAETLEDAEYAATLVRADVDPADFSPHPQGARDGATTPRQSPYLFFGFTDFEHGDADAALEQAPIVHEATYVQPSRHHNPMEPSATLAQWRGDELEVIDATQHVYGVQVVMAAAFAIPPEQVRVRSPHTGGGFGCKGFVWPHQIAAAAAARIVGRPVRIALSRAQMYSVITYQPQLVQTVRLGADPDGRLRAIDHESINVTSVTDDFVEYATEASRSTYAADAIRVRQRVQRANVNLPNPMRAPVEGCGLWALGSAMNELAEKVQADPIEVRLASYAEVHPVTGQPWSSKKLRECYEQGAAAVGWRRPSEPERDGHWLVGQGMADCAMGCFRNPSQAHVRINADGGATVLSGFQDIGTGTLTIFPQIAGAVLGLEPGLVSCEMGDTALPEAGPTYGSSSTMGVGAAVMAAARDAIARLEQRSGRRLGETPGVGALAAAMASAGLEQLVGEGSWAPDQDGQYALHTFGAVFVEVAVDPELGLVRLRRAVGRYSAGRIVNERTARAQMIGGIVWGWGKATLEASRQDAHRGRWLSKNLAGVALPVNADIPADIDIAFVDEVDEHASPIGGKGIGELGATGVDAAVADAVFHATGRRIRDLPITPDKLLR
jgi:xanthine dehydrogenase YagR molybdenum-binding subunit